MAAMTAPVRADSPKLEQARAAIHEVRYDDAQTLLVDALKEGGNSPAAVADIYRLAASTAVVLGQRDVAEQYYRRWLALDPSAALPANTAPKLREPFVAAEAYMNAHGRLSVKMTRRSPTTIEVIVASDPLAMVARVALDSGTTLSPSTLDAERSATLDAPGGTTITGVVILDEFGNHLLEEPVASISAPTAPSPIQDRPPMAPHHSFLRSWKVWAAPTIVFTVAGLYFGSRASSAQDDVIAISSDYNYEHYFDDLGDARSRRDRNALIANGLFIAAGACAVTTVVMYVTRDKPSATVVPTGERGSVGLAVVGAF
jgi:hypothetical protein